MVTAPRRCWLEQLERPPAWKLIIFALWHAQETVLCTAKYLHTYRIHWTCSSLYTHIYRFTWTDCIIACRHKRSILISDWRTSKQTVYTRRHFLITSRHLPNKWVHYTRAIVLACEDFKGPAPALRQLNT